MLRRRFGRTELSVPVFSCGGMRYQFKWQDQPLSSIPRDNQKNLEATVHRALELGVNHIETARGYGSSERQLGQILPRLARDQVIIQTKVSPKESAEEFRRDFEDSLQRLRLDYVDLFSLHGINDARVLEWATRPGGCFDVAQRLREQGKCRYVGFSTHGDTRTMLDAMRFGEPRTGHGFDYVNLHWYYIFQRNWPAIEEARRRDMGVFIISPSDKGGRLYSPPERLKELCAPLSPMVFNDLFCLSHEQVHTLSLGAARPSDFDEHMKVLQLLDDPASHLEPVEQKLEAAMEAATGAKSPESIISGLPRWQDTPNNFNLPNILWLRNLALGWGLWDYARWRFNMMKDAGHWFPGSKPDDVDEIDVDALMSCLASHPRRAQIPALLADAVKLLGGAPEKRLSQGGA